jgi:hypothetical protein
LSFEARFHQLWDQIWSTWHKIYNTKCKNLETLNGGWNRRGCFRYFLARLPARTCADLPYNSRTRIVHASSSSWDFRVLLSCPISAGLVWSLPTRAPQDVCTFTWRTRTRTRPPTSNCQVWQGELRLFSSLGTRMRTDIRTLSNCLQVTSSCLTHRQSIVQNTRDTLCGRSVEDHACT